MRYFLKKNKKKSSLRKIERIVIPGIKIVLGGGYGRPHGGCIKLKLKKKDVKTPIALNGGGYD